MMTILGHHHHHRSFNVTKTQYTKDHTLFTALRQCWTVSRSMLNVIWFMVAMFISIDRMPFLAPTLDNGDYQELPQVKRWWPRMVIIGESSARTLWVLPVVQPTRWSQRHWKCFTALRQCWTVSRFMLNDIWFIVAMSISIDRMPVPCANSW